MTPTSPSSGGQQDEVRLRSIAKSADPASVELIASLGLAPSSRILDVGCGTGQLAFALAERIASTGTVVALDVDTSAVDTGFGDSVVQVVTEDLRTWHPENGQRFDLIHARFVLAHLSDRSDLLVRMRNWLAPGGFMVITEPLNVQLDSSVPAPIAKVITAYQQWVGDAGMSVTFAGAVAGLLTRAGAEHVDVHVRASRCGGGEGVDRWTKLIMPFVEYLGGYGIRDEDIEQFFELAADSDTFVIPQWIVTTVGRWP